MHRHAGDDGVSPVIGTILMVAILVVLAAATYLWVSGTQGTGDTPQSISFIGRAADMPPSMPGLVPAADADTKADVVELVYVSGNLDFFWNEVQIRIDEVLLEPGLEGQNGFASADGVYCTSLPAGRTTTQLWKPTESVYLWKTDGASCANAAASPGLEGDHRVKLLVRNALAVQATVKVPEGL